MGAAPPRGPRFRSDRRLRREAHGGSRPTARPSLPVGSPAPPRGPSGALLCQADRRWSASSCSSSSSSNASDDPPARRPRWPPPKVRSTLCGPRRWFSSRSSPLGRSLRASFALEPVRSPRGSPVVAWSLGSLFTAGGLRAPSSSNASDDHPAPRREALAGARAPSTGDDHRLPPRGPRFRSNRRSSFELVVVLELERRRRPRPRREGPPSPSSSAQHPATTTRLRREALRFQSDRRSSFAAPGVASPGGGRSGGLSRPRQSRSWGQRVECRRNG